MSSAITVADYILNQLVTSSTMKLQKLVFYSYAYHLVKIGSPLFDDRIEAWINGPVIPALYNKHAHEFVINSGHFAEWTSGKLTTQERNSINHVIKVLGSYSGAELSDLTHSEAPWADARGTLDPTERSSNPITPENIRRFYGSNSCSNPVFA